MGVLEASSVFEAALMIDIPDLEYNVCGRLQGEELIVVGDIGV